MSPLITSRYSHVQANAPILIRAKRQCVLMIYVLTGLAGISQAVGSQSGILFLLNNVLYASAVTHWALVDSRLSGHQMLRIHQELFFFTWPLAIFVYLIGTRKWRGLRLWLLNVFGLYATLYFTFFVTLLLVDWARS